MPALPMLAGLLLWVTVHQAESDSRRRGAAGVALLTACTSAVLAIVAAGFEAEASVRWGSFLEPSLSASGAAGMVAILVPLIAAPIPLYATYHEPNRGLGRLTGLLVAFIGAMQLLVLAEDLFTLMVGWELVSALSWGLIAHDWRDGQSAKAAAHALNVTRFGSLGLFLAAGAAFSSTGSFAYAQLGEVAGSMRTLLVAGIVLAAVTKSAQVPFSPWLYSAMAGPTPVSALLHSATMVAAGVYVLVRLHPVLAAEGWFSPVVLGIGLATFVGGGIAAALQGHIKKVLAASTSAQYGLMMVAVGAGFPAAALLHLFAHAVVKAQLFLAAGLAISTAGTAELRHMRLGRAMPAVALLSAIGAAALAGLPPFGAAWTKEQIVAAGGSYAAWLGLVVAAAGGLSALYVTRFQLMAFGRGDRPKPQSRLSVPVAALGALALATVVLSIAWIPGLEPALDAVGLSELPAGKPWELVVSIGAVILGVYAAFGLDRARRLARLGVARAGWIGDWFGIPTVAEKAVVQPWLRLAKAAATFDRVVDRGVERSAQAGRWASRVTARLGERGVDEIVEALAAAMAGLGRWAASSAELIVDRVVKTAAGATGYVARDASRIHTGMLHHNYLFVAVGTIVLTASAAVWS
ncbi:MAG: NADH-quinone oxidoreductase subunit L [Actinobacteria bacterium]|nr:NADH-quinone oxidoreductase subunit L [Actinomycetota bacterium]